MANGRRPAFYSQLSLTSVFQRHRELSRPSDDTPSTSNEVAQRPREQTASAAGSEPISRRQPLHQEGESAARPCVDRPRSIVGSQTTGGAAEQASTDPSSARQEAFNNRCRLVLERETTGRLPPRLLAMLRTEQWSSYRMAGWANCSPWQPQLEMLDPFDDTVMGFTRPSDYIVSTACDSVGELVVSASSAGSLAVHHMDDLMAEAIRNRTHPLSIRHRDFKDVSRLRVSTGRRLEMVRWNPGNECWVGAVANSDRRLALYNLTSCRGTPTQLLNVNSTSCRARGFKDLAFFQHGQYHVAASGNSGLVYLWDTRKGSLPRTQLEPSHSGSEVNSMQVSSDGRTLLTANDHGDVLVWDLRGGTGAPRFGGQGPRSHFLLNYISIPRALQRLPQLMRQTEVPECVIHALLLHRESATHAGFHLSCGWSGVVDVVAGDVTHLHCPPSMSYSTTEAAEGADNLERLRMMQVSAWPRCRRLPTWAGSSTFCFGSGTGKHVIALDFSMRDSPCAVSSGAAEETRQTAVRIPLSEGAVSVTHSPASEALIAGTKDGRLMVLAPDSACLPT